MRNGWIVAAMAAALVAWAAGGSARADRGEAPVLRAGVAPDILPGLGDMERGNRHFREGRYREAVEAYEAALADGEDGPVLRYNLGTALLKLGRYGEAEEHLRGAMSVVDPEVREYVYYNLGQRFLEDARGAAADPQATSALYDAAVEAYRQALRLQPGDVDAKWNYELALQERDQQQSGGGGDGGEGEQDQEEQPGDQGGGGQAQGSPSESETGGDAQGEAPMTREQAERLLSAVEQDERELFQDKLRKGPQEARPTRDW